MVDCCSYYKLVPSKQFGLAESTGNAPCYREQQTFQRLCSEFIDPPTKSTTAKADDPCFEYLLCMTTITRQAKGNHRTGQTRLNQSHYAS